MKRLSITLIAFVAIFGIVAIGNTAPITFDDRGAWEAAVGSPDFLVDFNSYTTDTYFLNSPIDLGPLTIEATGPDTPSWNLIDTSPFEQSGSANGTPDAYFYVDDRDDPPLVGKITFDAPVDAWGFDIRNAGNLYALYMDLETPSGIQTLSLFEPTSDVFFGVLLYEGMSSITFRNEYADGFRIDNIAAVTAVPEPSTLLLIGTGLVGLVGFRRKFRG